MSKSHKHKPPKGGDIIGNRFVSLLDEYGNPADALAQLFSALSR